MTLLFAQEEVVVSHPRHALVLLDNIVVVLVKYQFVSLSLDQHHRHAVDTVIAFPQIHAIATMVTRLPIAVYLFVTDYYLLILSFAIN